MVAGLASVALLAATASPADAHSALESSSPTAGAQLRSAPDTIELRFNEPVLADYARASVSVGEGAPTTLSLEVTGAVVVADTAEVRTPTGERSIPWTLRYRVVSADGHPITGELRFAVAPAPPAPDTTRSAAPEDGGAARTEDIQAPPEPDQLKSTSWWWWTPLALLLAGVALTLRRLTRGRT
nr:copper resistance CopC family protein [Nocardioides perillae]